MKGSNQLLTGFTGSLENMTVTKAADGDSIIKGKITKMTNPKTEAQRSQRNVFAAMVAQGSLLLLFLNSFFKPTAIKHSPFNSYVKQSIAAYKTGNPYNSGVVVTTPPGIVYNDAPGMLITNGSTFPLSFPDVVINGTDTGAGTFEYEVEWPYDAGSVIQNPNDKVHCIWINEKTGDWNTFDTGGVRSDGSISVVLPSTDTNTLLVSLFAVDPATGEASKSKFDFKCEVYVLTKDEA